MNVAARHLELPSRRPAVLAMLIALLATLLTPVAGLATTQVIIEAAGSTEAAIRTVIAHGGQLVADLPLLDVIVARVPAGEVDRLEADASISDVTLDRPYAAQGKKSDDTLAAPSRTAADSVGAVEAWAAGYTGAGVGVAVVDTGLAGNGLRDEVAAGVDVSGDTRTRDGYGHGTFVSGLVTGDYGVAPGAHLVSIKVADSEGTTTLSSVMLGLGASIDARDAFGVRVVLLALGREADAESEVLEHALEQVWAQGLVVVVPSGNNGGEVLSPGRDPYFLTVGAIDDRGTADPADDSAPSWSSSTGGKPDVLAPGVSLVSLRAPGSVIDKANPQGRVGGQEFRGSGTSMAAAVTAGAAAVLLEAHPDLTPDEVKGRLVAAAAPGPLGAAAGVLDVAAAIDGPTVTANTELEPLVPMDLDEFEDEDAPDMQWPSWVGSHWAGSHWAGSHWAGSHWAGSHWAGSDWAGSHWAGSHWAGSHWAGSHWASDDWR